MNLRLITICFLLFGLLSNCDEATEISDSGLEDELCPSDDVLDIPSRAFKMGFSTWSYGPDISDRDETYSFITSEADIYSEQIDNKIPWDAWINGTDLPEEFVFDIEARISDKIPNHELIVSVSLLNTGRNDLLEDYDGSVPFYVQLSDQAIEDAYFAHLDYLIQALDPDYLVAAMEVNELYENAPSKWLGYQELMSNIRIRIKALYPDLPITESVTLHNLDESSETDFTVQITDYINQNMDFAAISFYPFFKGYHTKSDFQQSFDFLHDQIDIPIGFVETTHLAEDLIVESFDTNISSDVCEQKDYLELLLQNAYNEDYEFVIWWAYRDYDELWATFPDEVKDIGKLWRDTGLLDEDGDERPSYDVWQEIISI